MQPPYVVEEIFYYSCLMRHDIIPYLNKYNLF